MPKFWAVWAIQSTVTGLVSRTHSQKGERYHQQNIDQVWQLRWLQRHCDCCQELLQCLSVVSLASTTQYLERSYFYYYKKHVINHVFDDKLNQNCPFTKIFGTLITKTIGHRQVFLVSHFSYLVQLLYLGKLSRPKYHEFSLKLLVFPMLQ